MVMMLDALILRRRAPLTGWIGAGVGFCGIALLFYRQGVEFSFSPHVAVLFLAVVLWALGTSLSKVLVLPIKSALSSGIQQTAVGIGAMVAIVAGSPSSLGALQQASPVAWVSVLYLAVVGSAALAAYAWLLGHEPNHRIVTYALVNPLIAIFLGLVIAGEKAVPHLVPGAALILGGLALMFYGERMVLALKKTKHPPVLSKNR